MIIIIRTLNWTQMADSIADSMADSMVDSMVDQIRLPVAPMVDSNADVLDG
jgi:hypothetical protein